MNGDTDPVEKSFLHTFLYGASWFTAFMHFTLDICSTDMYNHMKLTDITKLSPCQMFIFTESLIFPDR